MIEEILRKKIGFNIHSVGRNKIDADVMCRMRICGITELDRYLELLRKSPEELDRLIETVTIPETWFFRLKNAFDYLEQHLRGEWLLGRKDKIRVLSMPCSTGEEPYSIAMMFFECGFKPDMFSIDAGDINNICLDKARDGIYSGNSFRGERNELMDKYFKRIGKYFELSPEVRRTVNFFHQNMLEYAPLPEYYDIVFCRNMLIYLDDESQRKSVRILSGGLKEGGLLFLGHSESGILFNSPFTSVKLNGCFTFRKNVSGESLPPMARPVSVARPATKVFVPPVAKAVPPPVRKNEIPVTKKPEPKVAVNPLQQVEDLADNGDLRGAELLCRSYLAGNKLEAKGYFLLGIILLAQQKYDEAEKFFSKTLYLDADHREALLSLAAVKEHAGDLKSAATYRERAKRVK